jgi:hypothetical protein
MPQSLKGTRVNNTSLENAAHAIAEIQGRRPLDDAYYFDNSQISGQTGLPGLPLNPSPTKRSEAGSVSSFDGTPSTSEQQEGLIYDPEGQPLPEEYQLGSPKTKEETERHYKEQLRVKDPKCTAQDLQRTWDFVAWQWDWSESLKGNASYRGTPETEGKRRYLENS